MGQIDFEFKDGDIILVHVNKFSTWYRKLFATLIKFVDGVYYHHAQIVSRDFIYEADTTVRMRPLDCNVGDEIMVLRPNMPLDEYEKNMLNEILANELGRKYDYWGAILDQFLFILLFRRVWVGKKGNRANDKPYCTELVANCYKKIRGYFPRPYLTSPSVLQNEAPNYFTVVKILK